MNVLNRLLMSRRENKMPSRLKHGLLISIAVIALFFTAEFGYGAVIEYVCDADGNLIQLGVELPRISRPMEGTLVKKK